MSLLAAFITMLGKQWLNLYLRNSGGSMIERCGDHQWKCDGLEKWPSHFSESLPVGVSPGMKDWLRVKRVARRRAADRSLGSDWRFNSGRWRRRSGLQRTDQPTGVDERIGETERRVMYEYQGCVETVVFLDVVRIVLRRLPLVYCGKSQRGGRLS